MNLAPDVIELGMRLVFPKGEKHAFFGEILVKVEDGNDFSVMRIVPPAAEAATRIMASLGLAEIKPEEVGMPLLWVVAG